jgi:hypothetical protein
MEGSNKVVDYGHLLSFANAIRSISSALLQIPEFAHFSTISNQDTIYYFSCKILPKRN